MSKFCTISIDSATPTKIVDIVNFGCDTIMQVIARSCDNAVIGAALITKNTDTSELNIYNLGSPVNCSFSDSSGNLYFSQTTDGAVSIDVFCNSIEC